MTQFKPQLIVKDWPIIIFWIVLVISTLLKVLPVLNYNFAFTMDQGRDMLDLRNIIIGHHLALIGPTTSINGVFLGPFWYYFNIIPFMIGFGDPTALVLWNIFWYQLSAWLFFRIIRKDSLYLGLIFSALFLMTPILFYSSRVSWNANTLPFITIFYFLSLLTLNKKHLRRYLLLGLISGLGLQLEAAFGIIFLPFAIIWLLLQRSSWRSVLAVISGFILTILPQLFFELHHSWLISQNIINEFSGKTTILINKLTLADTAGSHFGSYTEVLSHISLLSFPIIAFIFIASVLFLSWQLYQKRLTEVTKNVFLSGLLFIVFSFCLYLFYHYPFKSWFILGLHIPYLLIISAAATEAFRSNKVVLKLSILGIIIYCFIAVTIQQIPAIPFNLNDRSPDASSLRNEVDIVDLVYQKAQGQPFKVYVYVPSVYDFAYQYTFWWHGTQKYGFQPANITYLDNVPEYITNNSMYWNKKKPLVGSDYPIFLIYQTDKEKSDRLDAWLGNFKSYCSLEINQFKFQTTVQTLHPCQK